MNSPCLFVELVCSTHPLLIRGHILIYLYSELSLSLCHAGRGNGALAEHLRRPSARYEFLKTAPREPHVYDDPVPIRREKRDKIYEELRATPETECSTLSATPSDPDSLKSCQSLPWHVPNSRLLRNNDFNSPRKPVRVEPPKPPDAGMCVSQPPVAASPTSTKSPPGMDFRLILIPETSKMLQFAVERDTRLKSYFSKDTSPPVTDGKAKFPVITEEEELKLNAREKGVRIASGDPQKSYQSEASIKRGSAGSQVRFSAGEPPKLHQHEAASVGHPGTQDCLVSGDPTMLYSSGASMTKPAGNQDCLVSCEPQKLHCSEAASIRGPVGSQDQRRAVVPSVRVDCPSAVARRMNTMNIVNNNTAWDMHILKRPQGNIGVDENAATRPPGTPEQQLVNVCYNNARVSGHREPSVDTRTTTNTCDDTSPQGDSSYGKARDHSARLEEEHKSENGTAGMGNDPLNIPVLPLPLVHGVGEKGKVSGLLGSAASPVVLPTQHHSGNASNNGNNNSTEGRHHPYRPALASIKRSYRSPTSAQFAAILDPMVRR